MTIMTIVMKVTAKSRGSMRFFLLSLNSRRAGAVQQVRPLPSSTKGLSFEQRTRTLGLTPKWSPVITRGLAIQLERKGFCTRSSGAPTLACPMARTLPTRPGKRMACPLHSKQSHSRLLVCQRCATSLFLVRRRRLAISLRRGLCVLHLRHHRLAQSAGGGMLYPGKAKQRRLPERRGIR